ncbi:hypothetical protein JANAI62_32760 [Jannaschia pagri]|uniref:Helix-turn-helix domain-containing protein n=1 Tax=Jannaschia pagri TaxID=2829797 RepID=A0ABQ4NQH1_9RHOB|nr:MULTISPECIES: hypothetical protein [unclassified Jannaschia]GIT92818.1 hypothetical protein JANAI61_32760 [Jannaschia sp. AI_61]GIT96653.1 hypothetical protein JANAI62_32760 [Jannaschia sp. AI_62]
MTDRTPCRTPAGTTATNVPTWKVEACREALHKALADGPLPTRDIAKIAGQHLSEDDRTDLGSLGWHMTTVRLELEVRGEIVRLPGRPLRISLACAVTGP